MSEQDFAHIQIPDDIPLEDTVPAGFYQNVFVKEMDVTESSNGKVMIKPTFQITQGDYEGMMLFIGNYVIGTDDDPRAADPQTWRKSFGAKQFARLVKACQLTLGGKAVDKCKQLKGRSFNAQVTETMDLNENSQYYGSKRDGIAANGYYPLGQGLVSAGMASSFPGGAKGPVPQSRPPVPGSGRRQELEEDNKEAGAEQAELPI